MLDIPRITHISTTKYVGRFAPSPSGPLHFGSLVTALGSYLQAKSQHGKWLLRIDDLDPPREMPGASQHILDTLNTHGLHWDDSVVYQSQRHHDYQFALEYLTQKQKTYLCSCTRKQIKAKGEYYTGQCRLKGNTQQDCSTRFINTSKDARFRDERLGELNLDPTASFEDFIIKRKDGLYAYHLAAVVDDIYQGVTQVVRGADLLQPTMCQMALYQEFNVAPPSFIHLPVLLSASGFKLSKQNHVGTLNSAEPAENLCSALHFLGMKLPEHLQKEKIQHILDWATQHWSMRNITMQMEIRTPY